MEETLERRRRRSEDPLVALHFQLTQTRNEAGLETVVVADGAGLVVAGAGSWAACEELAAFAPLFGADVRSVDIDGERLLLCARGGSEDQRETALNRAAHGIRRILAA